MINLLLVAARLALEAALPTEVAIVRTASKLVRNNLVRKPSVRRLRLRGRRRGRRMGILDTALSTVRRGVATEEIPEVPTRVTPSHPVSPAEGPAYPSPIYPERINVPPGAYPTTPIPGMYFGGPQFTQNVYNSNTNVSPGPQPPVQKEPLLDPKLNNLLKADAATNLLDKARQLASEWLPTISWEGVVQATGFKTTPTRTVVHYALAVAFGLIKQQRVSDCVLMVDVDYETNHVTVVYKSKAYWLTEILTLGIYTINGAVFPPGTVKDINSLIGKSMDAFSRSLQSGFKNGTTAGAIELGKQGAILGGDALRLILRAYQNLGRLLGPLGVYDMGDETLYGGRASALLRAPFQPEPFNSMITDANGKPVPLLTRKPAPNPQPPVAIGTDPASGYSLDLRSLVAQALHDPGVIPPVPDTNVALPVIV